MAVAFDTNEVPPTDREELVRETIWESLVRVEIAHPADGKIAASGRITDFGQFTVASLQSNTVGAQRTPRLVRDDLEPNLFLALQVSGSSMVAQHGREAVLRPGDLAFFDTTVPYTLRFDRLDLHYFRIPHSELALPTAVIERLTASRMTAANPVVDVAGAYLQRLAANAATADLTSLDAMARPSIELIRAMIATHLSDRRLALAPLEQTFALRVLEYVRAHLADHDLTAARIARAHNISVRRLYAILAGAGVSLGQWIRSHRLEECRQDLAQPAARAVTIAAVARRWGFADATHFSRVFREAYGMSPREWRDAQIAQRCC